jgi:PAS domain S-box-containing protein
LPDLVIVIDVEGEITFCSAQVERVLRHKNDDLIGAKLSNLLVPSSREALQNLVNELVESEKAAATEMEAKRPGDALAGASGLKANENNGNESGSGAAAAVVSEPPSFPLSVIKVGPAAALDGNDTSDADLNGVCKEPSSLTKSASSLTPSPTASSDSIGSSGSDDGAKKKAASRSSDGSNTSSVCTESKKLQNANANLERNVRWHNKKLKANKKVGNMDDVIGGFVTANNASARLSSLQHLPEASSEGDSGYRESNDSREETSSSADGDSSTSNGKKTCLS